MYCKLKYIQSVVEVAPHPATEGEYPTKSVVINSSGERQIGLMKSVQKMFCINTIYKTNESNNSKKDIN